MLAPLLLTACSVCSFFPYPQGESPSQDDSKLEAKVVGRQRQRVTYFGQDRNRPSPGQVTLEFGRLKYGGQEATDAAAAKGDRWKAGLDYWSTLDTNATLGFGKKTVKPGHYYVVADRNGDRMKLVLLDAEKLRKKQVSFAEAAATKGGIAIPLERAAVEGKARNLAMVMGSVDRVNAPEKLTFKLQWGEHEYTSPVKVKNLGKATQFVQAEGRSRALLQDPASHSIVTIEHALPEWNSKRQAQIDKLKPGTRWRFGQNFWTSLETNVPVSIAKRKIAPGYYFLALEREPDNQWSLVLLDEDKVCKNTMDAFQASWTKGGTKVDLKTEPALKDTCKKLAVEFEPAGGDTATLSIRWGTYHLTAPIKVLLPNK
jgi:Protein of unknown function (DUF2911)